MSELRAVVGPRLVSCGDAVPVPDGCSLVEALIPTLTSSTFDVLHSHDGTTWCHVTKDTEAAKTFPAETFTGDISLCLRVPPAGFIKFTSSETQTAVIALVFHS